MSPSTELANVKRQWEQAWPQALADWSRYTQLREPRWCSTGEDEKREQLSESFAMIRLNDHAVVISLKQIVERGLQDFAVEILAHEIGHHVYCPADLTDNARMLARMQRGLPSCESYAPMVANLYADLLINNRLQRQCGRDMAGVYRKLKSDENKGDLWQLYMRMYELLWSLPPATLVNGAIDPRLNQDALLGTRLIRKYSRDWLSGAGRFACLLFPYIVDAADQARQSMLSWGDILQAGSGSIPDGLAEIDSDELDGILHPAEDPELSGVDQLTEDNAKPGDQGRVPGALSGQKSLKSYRSPFEYAELLKLAGANLTPRELVVKYYRERALPHVIPFPARVQRAATEPLPEGLDLWDVGQDFEDIDWFGSLTTSPIVIPGVTTRQRTHGESPGAEPQRKPLNLYLGIDCSGSMGDPAYQLSYPVLAGTIMALSALRAGAFVKVVLSGEPGKSIGTDGFIRAQNDVLSMMLNYLGTGYSFGIHRLAETFGPEKEPAKKIDRPTHILIVSDYDMFTMLNETGDGRIGWDVAREAVQSCGGGGTYVLQLPGYDAHRFPQQARDLNRMKADGWNVHLVNSMEELIAFARDFSRQQYQFQSSANRGEHVG